MFNTIPGLEWKHPDIPHSKFTDFVAESIIEFDVPDFIKQTAKSQWIYFGTHIDTEQLTISSNRSWNRDVFWQDLCSKTNYAAKSGLFLYAIPSEKMPLMREKYIQLRENFPDNKLMVDIALYSTNALKTGATSPLLEPGLNSWNITLGETATFLFENNTFKDVSTGAEFTELEVRGWIGEYTKESKIEIKQYKQLPRYNHNIDLPLMINTGNTEILELNL